MGTNFQIQIFGGGGTQIINQDTQSFSSKLVEVADLLKERTFISQEVQDGLFYCIDKVVQDLNANPEEVVKTSRYIVLPFRPISIPEILQDKEYIRSILETLSVIAFTELEFEVLENYVNIKIENKNTFGMYYEKGHFNLIDSYVRLLKYISDKKVTIPSSFVCIPLNTSGIYALDENRIKNIVTDIFGNYDYIKPLQTGCPKCLSLSSYIINEAQSVEDAQACIKERLGIG